MPSKARNIVSWMIDIQHNIALAERFAAGLSYDDFKDDLLRFYAVTRCLEIISEASRRLPDELKARHPTIDWRGMAAAGNIYRHEYDDVGALKVWDTLTLHLSPLRAVIEAELASSGR
jgi:uncharacterized protein with HEPN domain